MEYSVKRIKQKLAKPVFDKIDPTPLAVSIGQTETSANAVARIMYNSGIINTEQYYKMLGIDFDLDVSNGAEDFGSFDRDVGDIDGFLQSTLAEYEEVKNGQNRSGEVSRKESVVESKGNETGGTNSGEGKVASPVLESESGLSVGDTPSEFGGDVAGNA